MTDTSTKKHITVIASEFFKFWSSDLITGTFDERLKKNPEFGFLAKLCYQGHEFSKDASKREPCLRFFPSELNSGKDLYVECFDWEQDYYTPGFRTLYRLQHDQDWYNKKDLYIETTAGGLKTPTYTIRLSMIEVINKTPVTALTPIILTKSLAEVTAPQATPEELSEEEFDKSYSELADDHYTKATIRDIYCMIHNVPLTNKKWLNQLIEKGKTWQK